jgi:hypothetical protein
LKIEIDGPLRRAIRSSETKEQIALPGTFPLEAIPEEEKKFS